MLDRLPHGARVLLIRLRSLGDCVLTIPAVDLLRRCRPDLDLRVMVDAPFREIFGALSLDPSPGNAFRFRPALTINFHGGTRSLLLTAASLAPRRAGFAHHAGAWLYNIRIPRAQEILGVERKVHTAEHLASAMFHLGVPRAEIPRAKIPAAPPPPLPPYAVLHPFAATPEKTWPADRFVRLARHLRAELGLEPRIIGSAADGFEEFSEFAVHRGASLGELGSLLSGAELFIGNDSGPAHMAAAFGIPVLVFFGPSDPVVWAPWRVEHEQLVAGGPFANIPYEQALTALNRLAARA
jgi:heptosyltransferase-3